MKTSQVRNEVIAEEVAALRLAESFTDTLSMLNVDTEKFFPGSDKPITAKLISSHFSMFLRYMEKEQRIDIVGKTVDPNYGLTEAKIIGEMFYTFLTTHEKAPIAYRIITTSDEFMWLEQVCFYRAERAILEAKFKSMEPTVFCNPKAMARVFDVFTGKEKYRINTQVVKQQVILAIKETLTTYPELADPKTFAENIVNALDFQAINDALHLDTQQRLGRYVPVLLTSGEESSDE
jgi:hypothetical protein